MVRAFQIDSRDNVATLLAPVDAGASIEVGGAAALTLTATAPLEAGHKVALVAIVEGEAVRKYGVRIGHATHPIEPGDWVHLHNLASDFDERSATLDLRSGAPTDTDSAYA